MFDLNFFKNNDIFSLYKIILSKNFRNSIYSKTFFFLRVHDFDTDFVQYICNICLDSRCAAIVLASRMGGQGRGMEK